MNVRYYFFNCLDNLFMVKRDLKKLHPRLMIAEDILHLVLTVESKNEASFDDEICSLIQNNGGQLLDKKPQY